MKQWSIQRQDRGCIWCWGVGPTPMSAITHLTHTATTHLTCASALPCLILSANIHATNNTTTTARASPAPFLLTQTFHSISSSKSTPTKQAHPTQLQNIFRPNFILFSSKPGQHILFYSSKHYSNKYIIYDINKFSSFNKSLVFWKIITSYLILALICYYCL